MSMGDSKFQTLDVPPEADTPEAAVRFLIAELVRAGSLPAGMAADVARAVWQRERLGSTAIGRGVALPHAKARGVAGVAGVVGRCAQPLDWPGALDGGPVRLVCLVVTPAGSPGSSLRALEWLSRRLRGG